MFNEWDGCHCGPEQKAKETNPTKHHNHFLGRCFGQRNWKGVFLGGEERIVRYFEKNLRWPRVLVKAATLTLSENGRWPETPQQAHYLFIISLLKVYSPVNGTGSPQGFSLN